VSSSEDRRAETRDKLVVQAMGQHRRSRASAPQH
jgi:hypothetical protein